MYFNKLKQAFVVSQFENHLTIFQTGLSLDTTTASVVLVVCSSCITCWLTVVVTETLEGNCGKAVS